MDEENNLLEMSDEDILAMTPPSPIEELEEVVAAEDTTEEVSEEVADEVVEEITQEASEELEEEPEDQMMTDFQTAASGDEVVTEEATEEEEPAAERARDSSGKFTKQASDTVANAEEAEQAELNYKEEYERLLAPFRANGKDMQVGGVDDALTLMKMGANYNKKMAGLKPNLKLMKMLGNNDLLDEDKLTYLIDLQKKNPEAVAKFIKESGIDPLDLDTETEPDYRPGTYTVGDKEVELDMVLEGIQDTPSFDETIDIIGNKWDQKSRDFVLDDPALITVINDHVASGIHKQITDIVESERVLGRLTAMSDLDAYKHVGDILQEQGAFNKAGDDAGTTEPMQNVAPSKVSKSNDAARNSKKRAAGSPRGTPGKTAPQFDPLSMSDEDFEKAAASIGI